MPTTYQVLLVKNVLKPLRISRHALRSQSTQSSPSTASATVSHFDRFIARTPTNFLRTRLQVLKNAPLTTITSFLLLHEITAVVPLFGLAGAFHYYQWLPPFFAEGTWVLKGVTLFGNYFRRKGWISSSDAASAKSAAEQGHAENVERRSTKKDVIGKWWNRGEGGTRWVIEFATAYAVVKALLPIRIVISVWGAPWFARWSVIPMQNLFKRMFGKGKAAKAVQGGPK
ncbi:hypothetical protein PMZ80_006375 [Knufia obscura]|uniref:Uncharacterized protein n=2 Tax=Knufia TaxID=430999 RepID=A0AAN8I5T3_9EURO|nr:hypothetical protein PMZ80_006375 [Knufia obscura]KAK5953479.1 hypothetical protein OHC33_005423 [Knufia fluminis]